MKILVKYSLSKVLTVIGVVWIFLLAFLLTKSRNAHFERSLQPQERVYDVSAKMYAEMGFVGIEKTVYGVDNSEKFFPLKPLYRKYPHQQFEKKGRHCRDHVWCYTTSNSPLTMQIFQIDL
jgi:hypothetical protein